MASCTLSGQILRKCGRQLLTATTPTAAAAAANNGGVRLAAAASLHTTSSSRASKNESGRYVCTMIPGDGVGPDLMYSVQDVIKSVGAPLDFEVLNLSEVNQALSAPFDAVQKSLRKNGVAIKGVINVPEHGRAGELLSVNQEFRNKMDLYANVVNVKSLPGVKSRHQNMDFVVIREQTEGEYSALEHESVPGVVECLKVVTAEKSRRIAKFAFDYATRFGRKKVTAVHKANIMKLGDGLFLRSCSEIAKLYPGIEFESMIVDNTTMQLASNPQQFDVMVMPNLYGNIIDNLAAGLVGGAGLVAGASYSSELAVFEPGARHTFDSAVGKNSANPTAILLSSVKLLNHLGLSEHATKIESAVLQVLQDGKVKTRDLGGFASTQQFTAAVINSIN